MASLCSMDTQHTAFLGSAEQWAHMSLLHRAMCHQRGVEEEREMEDKRAHCYYQQWLACLPWNTWPNNLFSPRCRRAHFTGLLSLHNTADLTSTYPLVVTWHIKNVWQTFATVQALHIGSGVNGGLLNIDLWPSAKAGSVSSHFH